MLPPWSGSSRPSIQQDPSSFNAGAHRTILLPSASNFYGDSCSCNSGLWVMCQSPNTLPHTQIHTPLHTHIYLVIHTHTPTHIYPHMHISTHTYTHIYMHACTHIHMHICTHMHTHTYTSLALTLRYLFPVHIMHQELNMKPATREVQSEDCVCYV